MGNPRSDLPTSLFLRSSEVDPTARHEDRKDAAGLPRVTLPVPL
jgi:hypothetical protein